MATTREARQDDEHGDPEHDSGNLQTLLAETRILLPGTQVFIGFLTTLPFTHRFTELDQLERGVYIATFFTTMLALVCFETPAAYHRLARPIHHKVLFKSFASTLLVAGLVPFSIAIVLASFLVTSLAIGRGPGYLLAGIIAVVVAVLWWTLPIMRAHDRVARSGDVSRRRPLYR